MPRPIALAAVNLAAMLPSHITMLRARRQPHIPRLPLRAKQPRTRPLRTQPQVAADMKAAAVAVVDMKAADTTKLLLHRQQFARQAAELTSSAVLLWPKHFRMHRAQMDVAPR